jgi:hypothetical protein
MGVGATNGDDDLLDISKRGGGGSDGIGIREIDEDGGSDDAGATDVDDDVSDTEGCMDVDNDGSDTDKGWACWGCL